MNFKFSKLLAIIDLNTLLYLLSKIPIIKYLGFNTLISKTNTKTKIAFIGTLFKTFLSFVLNMIVPWIVTVVIFNIVLKTSNINDFYTLRLLGFVVLFCLLEIIDRPSFLNDYKNAYIFMGMLGVNPDVYYKNKIVNSIITNDLSFLFVSYVIFKNWTVAFAILFSKIACGLISNFIYLNYINKYEKMMNKTIRRIIYFTFILLCIFMVYKRVEFTFSKDIFYILGIISFVISILLFNYFMRFKYYNQIKMVMANSDVFKSSFTTTTGMTEDYKELSNFSYEKNIEFLNQNKHLVKESYIEKAFKIRFKDVLKSHFKSKLYGIIFLSVVYIISFKLGITQVRDFRGLSTFGIAIVLLAGYSGNYLQICFRNIDLPFLYHKLFTQKEIENSLNIRLKHIAYQVIPNFFVALVSISIIGIINKIKFDFELMPKVILIYFLLLVSREMWEIMMYYLLCPYSSDLSNKSILSKVIKIIMSGLIGFCYVGGFEIEKMFYIVLTLFGITIIVFLISKRFFSRTFKIRY